MDQYINMIDVCQEAQQCADEKVKAARLHMGTAALAAFVNGADPAVVAEKCGFTGEDVSPSDPVSIYSSMRRDIFGEHYMTQASTPVQQLEQFLKSVLHDLIHERTSVS